MLVGNDQCSLRTHTACEYIYKWCGWTATQTTALLKFGCGYTIYKILHAYKDVGETCIHEFIYGPNPERKYNQNIYIDCDKGPLKRLIHRMWWAVHASPGAITSLPQWYGYCACGYCIVILCSGMEKNLYA